MDLRLLAFPRAGLAAVVLALACTGARAGLELDADSPDHAAFYKELRAELDRLSRSEDPVLRRLHEALVASPAPIRIRPMTDDRSTWHASGDAERGHTDPVDGKAKSGGRSKPTGATCFIPRDAVERGKSHWKSGVLVHELTHALDLANGRYDADVKVRERRAVFVQNAWRERIGEKLRATYHGNFETSDFQEASKRGEIEAYARYIFTRSDLPSR